MNKRKTSELRKSDSRFSQNKKSDFKTFYINENKTIDFTQHQPSIRSPKINNRPVELIPKTINQEKYILALLDDSVDIVIASGPAGTGKTYLAMQSAIKALKARQCDRIILTRPAVEVDGEKHGFLPGDINAKMEPWTKPLLDVIREYYSTKDILSMLADQVIEIAPLAFCRGRNFKNSWVILDEAQNCTISQIKMILTRIGVGSKMVVSGDIEQTDRKTADNGLLDLQQKLEKNCILGIQSCTFDLKDIQRHKLIGPILKMYG